MVRHLPHQQKHHCFKSKKKRHNIRGSIKTKEKIMRNQSHGKITVAEIREQYKSWRGNQIKYNVYKSVRSTDALYKY